MSLCALPVLIDLNSLFALFENKAHFDWWKIASWNSCPEYYGMVSIRLNGLSKVYDKNSAIIYLHPTFLIR